MKHINSKIHRVWDFPALICSIWYTNQFHFERAYRKRPEEIQEEEGGQNGNFPNKTLLRLPCTQCRPDITPYHPGSANHRWRRVFYCRWTSTWPLYMHCNCFSVYWTPLYTVQNCCCKHSAIVHWARRVSLYLETFQMQIIVSVRRAMLYQTF